MKIKTLIQRHAKELTSRFGTQLLPGHRKALDAMLACRSQCGECYCHCEHCHTHTQFPLSCGHRSCPQCQHHLAEAWQERQQAKQLPVNYFMVTFTIPYPLRKVAWEHQHIVYHLLFKAAVEALQTIAKNNFGLAFGMTAVLHTQERDKEYHPHVHVILPSGGLRLDQSKPEWKALPQNVIVNEYVLAKIYKAILLRLFFENALEIPKKLPEQWVSHIRRVGRGEKAIQYLSRYLYRGVISENDILEDAHGQVTFRYQNSKTRKLITKQQDATAFIWTLLKHVLPRGFRRVRDYGFLHGNAKKALEQIQQTLKAKPRKTTEVKKGMPCPHCATPMIVDLVLPKSIPMQFRFYEMKNYSTTTQTA